MVFVNQILQIIPSNAKFCKIYLIIIYRYGTYVEQLCDSLKLVNKKKIDMKKT